MEKGIGGSGKRRLRPSRPLPKESVRDEPEGRERTAGNLKKIAEGASCEALALRSRKVGERGLRANTEQFPARKSRMPTPFLNPTDRGPGPARDEGLMCRGATESPPRAVRPPKRLRYPTGEVPARLRAEHWKGCRTAPRRPAAPAPPCRQNRNLSNCLRLPRSDLDLFIRGCRETKTVNVL